MARPPDPRLVARGAAWAFAARGASQAIQVATSIALARLLAPELFGLVGMAATVVALAGVLVDAGLFTAVVQRPGLGEEETDATFGTTVALGVAVALVLGLGAPLVARFYGAPVVAPLTRVGAVAVAFAGVAVVPRALLVRSLRVRDAALIELAAAAVGAGAGVALALAGAGVWALAATAPVAGACSAALALAALERRPRLRAPWKGAQALLPVSVPLLAFSLFNYLARNIDNVLVGAWLGERELGFYGRAYSIMLLPLTEVTGVLANTMLPVLSRVQGSPAAVRSEYLRALRLVTFVTFPAMSGLAVLAGPFVRVVFGSAWDGVAPMLAVLAVVGALQSAINPTGWLYQSQGRTDRMFRWGLFASLILAGAIAAGAWRGSGVRVAWFYLAGNAVLLVPAYLYAGRTVGLGLAEIGRSLLPAAAATAAMVVVVGALDQGLGGRAGPLVRLTAGTVLGITAYGIAVHALRVPAAAELADIVRGIRPPALRWLDPVLAWVAGAEKDGAHA